MQLVRLLSVQLIFVFIFISVAIVSSEDLHVVTVATEQTDGFNRLLRSLTVYGYSYEVFGLGEEWKGGQILYQPGGGHKINILRKELEKYKDDREKVLLFTDAYDVILLQSPSEILKKFKALDARVVFGAESFCWPDISLQDKYPQVSKKEKRYLNSGAFIGYANNIYEIISFVQIADNDDDQLYYTQIFLNEELREKHKIKLDTFSTIFQNLNGAVDEIAVSSDANEIVLSNTLTNTNPSVLHGNGASKLVLNRLGNYLVKSYSLQSGCLSCNEDVIKLAEDKEQWPEVTVGVFIEQATPFLREFFLKLSQLNYPKSKMSILIHNNLKYHSAQVESFVTDASNHFKSIKLISPDDDSTDFEARSEAIEECKKTNCPYYLSVDSTAHLDNPDTLKLLIEQNRKVLAPIMIRKDTTWSNVWGDLNENGFYARSDDYLDIINRVKLGVWNLPYINEAVLIHGDVLSKIKVNYENTQLDSSMAFAASLREQGVFMYGTNMHYFGHLVNPDGFNSSLIRPEMYEIFNNFQDWVSRYIRPEYFDYVEGKELPLQPCPDVFWFPVVTDEFCDDLITMVEDYGQWSGGNNNHHDPRIDGGYENVPTVDIHMKQIGWDKHYLHIIRMFVQPIQRKVFIGYYHDPPQALLNFVVRYRPGEQDHLTPHHDASTYTLNIALNRPNIDFQGGGCRFVRYECKVTDTKKGWGMIHPGRLTHYHEGLKVTGGTRYIMVSFIDP